MTRLNSGAVRIGLAIVIVLSGCDLISGQSGVPFHDPGADLFTNGTVLQLSVEIKRDQLDALKADNRRYARCTVREADSVYEDVGVHLKGAAGSFRELDDKPALTLSFNRFKPSQRFHGLRKIHLNNSVQDPSYLTELICGRMFEEAGVPAARVAHARVELNKKGLGFYVVKEGFTGDLLSRYFKDVSGNLYDGGFLKDIPDLSGEESENQSTNKSDLKALAEAARESDPRVRWERLNQAVDMDRFISFMAVEILTWHWDGYSMNKNNYRLYHDPTTGKMVFFPHGMDQMFGDADGALIPDMHGMVADAVIQSPEGRRRYLDRLATLYTNVYNPRVLINRVNEVYARIHPAVAAISKHAGQSHEEAVSELRDRIVGRYHGIQNQLAAAMAQPVSVFDENGVGVLGGWQTRDGDDQIKLELAPDKQGRPRLHIVAAAGCHASWRTRVRVPPGSYHFEGRVRTRRVEAAADDRGEGAGLRISGRDRVNGNKLNGTSDWQRLTFPFEIANAGEQVELVCELRANKGEAWFDVESLKLVRDKR